MALIAGIIFALFTVLIRLTPHAPNFVPVAALALWAGTYLPKKWGVVTPIAVMLVSDALIGFYDWRLMLVVYISFALTVLIGWWVKGNKSVSRVILGSLTGSMFFFLATNFAVWALSSWYPHNLAGLLDAYVMGAPFFRNTLAGDLFYNGVFFGSYVFAVTIVAKKLRSLDLGARLG